MTTPSPSSATTWTERLRYVTDPASQKSLAGKSITVAVAAILGLVVGGVFFAIGQTLLAWIVIGLAVAAIVIWLIVAANARAAASMTGDDLIEIVVADEGVLAQGGLPVRWCEMSDIAYTWSSPVTFTGGIAAAAANGVGTLMDDAGVDRSMKVVTISLKDYDAVKARATTKARKMVLFEPMLGTAATVHIGLQGRSAAEVHRVLQLLGAAAAQNGVGFTRQT